MEAYVMNPNSGSFEGFRIEEIIKRKETVRIYKFSLVILKMEIFLKWSLLCFHSELPWKRDGQSESSKCWRRTEITNTSEHRPAEHWIIE